MGCAEDVGGPVAAADAVDRMTSLREWPVRNAAMAW